MWTKAFWKALFERSVATAAGVSGPTNGPSFGPETLTATVVAVQDRDTNVGPVAGDASDLANGTPVDVVPTAPTEVADNGRSSTNF